MTIGSVMIDIIYLVVCEQNVVMQLIYFLLAHFQNCKSFFSTEKDT